MVIIYHPWLKGSPVDFYMLLNKIKKWHAKRGTLSGLGSAYEWYHLINQYPVSQPSPVYQSTAKLTMSLIDDVRSLARDIYNYTHAGNLIGPSKTKSFTVEKLQRLLMALGYPLPKYGHDGIFGSETTKAVKDFQRDHGLTADGVVGNKTSEALLAVANSASGNGGVLSSIFDKLKDIVVSIFNGKTDQMAAKAAAYDALAKLGGYKGASGGAVQPIIVTQQPSYRQPEKAGFLGIPTPYLIGGGLLIAGLYFMEKEKGSSRRKV